MKTNTNTGNISIQLQEHLNKYDVNDRDFIKMLTLIDQYVHQKTIEARIDELQDLWTSGKSEHKDIRLDYKRGLTVHERLSELQASLNTEGEQR